MSELREELLGTAINKKRIIGVVLVAILLISMFAFSVFFFSFLFGSQRRRPNKNKKNTPYEEVILEAPPLPLDFLAELMKYLNDTGFLSDFIDLVDPQDFADILEEMMDGDIDGLDLSGFSEALLPLLGAAGYVIYGEQEVFRIYNSSDAFGMIDDNKLSKTLWKYECFDEYNGDTWNSTANTFVYDFISFLDYATYYSSQDILKIKMPLTPEQGSNSMVIPSLFPTPFFIENSIFAPNVDQGSINLNKDEFNCSILDLDFYTSDAVNLTFELFGLDLPTEQNVNDSAVLVTSPSAEYSALLNYFTQLPPDSNTYINSHPFFKSHYDALDLIIDDTDNPFVIATKIREYLQTNFDLGFDAIMNDPAEEGEDIVEWFCEHGEGLYSEFASAFCVFARTFDVASRFVDGFKTESFNDQTYSWEVDEVYDSQEGAEAILIKYKNLYNWAEIYVPTDATGNGNWIQFDIAPHESPAGQPSPQFNLTLYSNFTAGYRGEVANLTATLSSPTGSSVVGRTITFTDETTGMDIGVNNTDNNGKATLLLPINDSQVVGPHLITSSFNDFGVISNPITYVVYGNVDVILESVSPQEINRSIDNSTYIQGYVDDPVATQRVEGATVEFLLLQPGTNNKIANPFDIINVDTDNTGRFDTTVNVDPSVIRGSYEVRVDFNGSWYGTDLTGGIVNASSNRFGFNVTEEVTYILLFSINGTPTNYPFSPTPSNIVNVTRTEQLNLSVILIDDFTRIPVAGENVEFYDYTNGDFLIANDITDTNGIAWILYNIGSGNKAGPTLVYARSGINRNYSYFIVNESIGINVISYSNPLQIDVAGVLETSFNIQCELIDAFNNPIFYSQLNLLMNRSSTDFTGYLTPFPPNPVFPVSLGSNSFNFNRGVDPNTLLNNYTLTLEFLGIFDLTTYPYTATFNLPYFYNSIELLRQLRVYDYNDVQIYLFVEGKATRDIYDDVNKPERYTPGDNANFTVFTLHQGLPPLEDMGEYITIRDEYTGSLLGNHTFTSGDNGYHEFIISTSGFHAGIHKIRVQFMNFPTINTTFIIINETVSFNVNPPTPSVTRVIDSLTISGSVVDGPGLRGLKVSLQLFNSTGFNVSQYLIGSRFDITDNNGFFQFSISSIDLNCPKGPYNIRIDFNGTIYLSGIPGINLIPNYMINTNSSLISLNITAGTVIFQTDYYTKYESMFPDTWQNGDTLYVLGSVEWDNGTALSNMYINVTVKRVIDGSVVAYNDTVRTDSSGNFNVSLSIDISWPTYRIDTEIWVYFDPEVNNLTYVKESELEFT